jgi:hypothetical protein
MGTIGLMSRYDPGIIDGLHTRGMAEPIIFKPKNIGFGNGSTDLYFAWQMVRNDPSKREDHGRRILGCPRGRNEKPVNLLKKRSVLHVAPSKTATFDGKLNEAQVIDNAVED